MASLRDIFSFHARALPETEEHANSTETQTGADGMDSLTLEMRDNPLESFMRKIEKLIDLDPAEAFRMASHALTEKVFGAAAAARLTAKVTELAELLQRDRQLGLAFTKSALGLEPVKAEASPAIAAPSLTAAYRPLPVPAPSFAF